VAALEKQQQEYAGASADLLVDLLTFLRAPINAEEEWPKLSAENLGDWIAAIVATETGSPAPTPNPSWRALWTVPGVDKAFEEPDQLAKALETGVDGALNVMIERKTSLDSGKLRGSDRVLCQGPA
jgi:hypothetical protein